MNNKKKREIIVFSISTLTIILFIFFLFKANQYLEKKDWLKTEKITVDLKIIARETSGNGMPYHVGEFLLNGKTIRTSFSSQHVIGERFKLQCDINNIENSRITTFPYFLETEKTKFTLGKITELTDGCVSFYFWLGNAKFEKEHCIYGDINLQYPGLIKDSLYKVEYWTKNPNRSLLLFKEKQNYCEYWWRNTLK